MVFLIQPSKAAWDAKRAELLACPMIPADVLPLAIGECALEFPGDDDTPPSGRAFGCHNVHPDHCDWLVAQGYEVRMGSLDGPLWGTEE